MEELFDNEMMGPMMMEGIPPPPQSDFIDAQGRPDVGNQFKLNTKDLLETLKHDLKQSEARKKEVDQKIQTWKREYNGEPYGNERNGRSQIVSRDIKKQSEWQHAGILDPFVATQDIIKTFPVTWEDREAARQNELLLNTQFTRMFPRYNFMTKAIKVLDQEGTAIIQTGWDYEDEEVIEEEPLFTIDPMTMQPIPTGETKEVKRTVIKKNQPTAKVCRNEDIFIDPTCMDDMDECQFVVYRYETDMSTLKADGRYKNLGKIYANDYNDIDYESADRTMFKFKDDPRKKIIVHEYWGNYDMDGDGEVEPIVCCWVNDTIIRLESNPYPDGKPPFIIVPFASVPFQMYGESHAEILGNIQKVNTAILRGIIDNMAQSTNGQKGIKKGALDIANRKKFLAGENFEYNTHREEFWEGSYNEIPSSVLNVYSMLSGEAESITGVKSFSGGISGQSLGSSATAARGVMDSTATRRLNIVRNIAENLVKPLMRKWMAYNAEFLEEEQVVRITNEEFVTIRRDDLAGLIDIDIQVSTNEDNANKAQEIGFLLQTIGPNQDPEITRLLMVELLKLHRLPDAAKMVAEYQPQPDPFQEQMKELELEMMRANISERYARVAKNETDAMAKGSKAQLDEEKANATRSKADLDDLEFLRKESGLGFEEEMTKKEHDRQSQLDREYMKQLSSPRGLVS